MARVYLAEQESLGRMVALEVIRAEHLASPVAIERFRREARTLAQVRHPHVVDAPVLEVRLSNVETVFPIP